MQENKKLILGKYITIVEILSEIAGLGLSIYPVFMIIFDPKMSCGCSDSDTNGIATFFGICFAWPGTIIAIVLIFMRIVNLLKSRQNFQNQKCSHLTICSLGIYVIIDTWIGYGLIKTSIEGELELMKAPRDHEERAAERLIYAKPRAELFNKLYISASACITFAELLSIIEYFVEKNSEQNQQLLGGKEQYYEPINSPFIDGGIKTDTVPTTSPNQYNNEKNPNVNISDYNGVYYSG